MNQSAKCIQSVILSLTFLCAFGTTAYTQRKATYLDQSLPVEKRVDDLMGRLSMEEKINLLGYRNKAIPRLHIPAYNWWNESLHGVARAGEATVFPQTIGMAASFDDSLLHQVASVISTEARAKHNLAMAEGGSRQYFGLTFWSPNINIFRDPRWGRGQETYGEDPYLTSRMAVAYINGMQGYDPDLLKTAACAKHFAAYSGPEATRHGFNAVVDEKDLRETYLYAFRQAVEHGKVASVMTAYNAVNGVPCSINPELIGILKNEWHFNGYLVNDCGALNDIITGHKSMRDPVRVAAAAIKAGIDLDCGSMLQHAAMKALQQHLLTEKDIDSSLAPLLRTEFRLGFFDDAAKSPYADYGKDSVHNEFHVALARKMADESIVLLKNDGVLPLRKNNYHSLLVTGLNASLLDALSGSYHGVSGNMVNFVEGISKAVDPGVGIEYDLGYDNSDTTHFGGIWASTNNDVTVAVIGLTPLREGEEGDAFLSPGAKGDRANLQLPAAQIAFIKALHQASNHPIIAVVTGGSDIDLSSIEPYVNAILMAWYPGEQGGNAVADVLFGKVAPAGRLPVTFYKSIGDLPPFSDYDMKGRTYRYYGGAVEYPFGYGLSYTTFKYSWDVHPREAYGARDTLSFSVDVENTGAMDADEVVQCYIAYPSGNQMPIKELKEFKRVHIDHGGRVTVQMSIPLENLKKWDAKEGRWKLYGGAYRVVIGNNSRDEDLKKAFTVTGG